MNTPRRNLLISAIVALFVGAIGRQFYATREPSYQGKTVSEWLEEGFPNGPAEPDAAERAQQAIHAIGKKAVPTLLRRLQTMDSPLKVKIRDWVTKQSLVEFHFTAARVYRWQAAQGFAALGWEARDALPEMRPLFYDPELAETAASAMAFISPDAIPILRSGLTNQNEKIRLAGLSALSMAGTNGYAAVPDFVHSLDDSSPVVRKRAALALGRFGQDPALVLPALCKSAQEDSDIGTRQLAIYGMGCFSNRASSFVPALQEMLRSANADARLLKFQLTNALKRIAPTAWPNGDAPPPADAPKSPSPVGPAFQPAGSGGFPAPSTSGGPESPPNRQPGKAALPDTASPRATGQPAHPVQGIP